MNPITAAVLSWYKQNARDLPWRQTKDPFKIWLSEIILQQTKVEQGMPYFHKFAQRFENIQQLANASEDEVLLLWQGLGYYSRARNMLACARKIVKDFDGIFPESVEDLRRLPGIGPYTAAAISSFAFQKSAPAVDGNFNRIISRIFGVKKSKNSSGFQSDIQRIADELIENAPPHIFNQAMMDFGSLVCKPRQALCNQCPVLEYCFAFKNNLVDELPVTPQKKALRNRYFHFGILKLRNQIILSKREEKDIWKNLYQLPLIETSEEQNLNFSPMQFANILNFSSISLIKTSIEIIHKLSHQKIIARFYHFEINDLQQAIVEEKTELYGNVNNYLVTDIEAIKNFAMPQLVKDYLIECGLID